MLTQKLNQNAKNLRFISRAQIFQRNRLSLQQPDYFKHYPPNIKSSILASINGPLPTTKTAPTLFTISYLRRASSPVYRSRNQQGELQAHMLYQSLWMLAGCQEKQYQNYTLAARDFEKDLSMCLGAGSKDIREMAIIVAGNKIIGRQQDIIRIVGEDPKQIWVLINHVFQKRISPTSLLPYLVAPNLIIFQTFYQLTNLRNETACPVIIQNQGALLQLVGVIGGGMQQIKRCALGVLGNLAAEKQQYIQVLLRQQIGLLKGLTLVLQGNNKQTTKDACWLLANLSTCKQGAVTIILDQNIMSKLVSLFCFGQDTPTRKQLCHLFICLAHNADRQKSFTLFHHQNLLSICHSFLILQDPQLNAATLSLIKQLIQLGQSVPGQDGSNLMINLLVRTGELRNQIAKKSYSQNNEISLLSGEIIELLEEVEDDY